MRIASKLILAALAASAILALGVSGVSARSFRVSEKNFELIWDNAFTGKTKLEFEAGGRRIRCKVTLLGRFLESTIKKETLINQSTINHGELRECEGGTATIHTETMPWNNRYRSFSGTLPNGITGITVGLIGASFRVREPNGLTCEPVTEVNHPGVGIVESGFPAPENIRADETATIPLTEFPCNFAGSSRFAGRGLIRNLPRTAKITVTLI